MLTPDGQTDGHGSMPKAPW